MKPVVISGYIFWAFIAVYAITAIKLVICNTLDASRKRYKQALQECIECLEMNEDQDVAAIEICRDALEGRK